MTRVAMIALAIATGAAAACSTAPPVAGELRPSDFAHGATIDAPANAPFFMLDVPGDLFTGTAWPDQRDIRVFNASGAAVPFARVAVRPAGEAALRIPLRSFRLEGQGPGGDPIVELDTAGGGLRFRMAPGIGGDRVEYWLELGSGPTDDIRALHFDWEDAGQNWQQQVSVFASRNMTSWTPVATNRPLIDLRTGSERLRHTEVLVERTSPDWARFWRLQFAPGFVPSLTAVTAETVSTPIEAPTIALEAAPESPGDGSLILRLPTAQPVARIEVYPGEANSVLPLTIETRRGDGPWRHMRTAVAYRIQSPSGEQVSPPIAADGSLVDALRLRPFGTSWGTTPPSVTLERPGLNLVVNARGAGPFLLAWGSRAANDSSIALATLLPDPSLDAVRALPPAGFASRRELGGASRLTEATPAERASRTQTIVVWALLIFGALGLSALALKVYRETDAGVTR